MTTVLEKKAFISSDQKRPVCVPALGGRFQFRAAPPGAVSYSTRKRLQKRRAPRNCEERGAFASLGRIRDIFRPRRKGIFWNRILVKSVPSEDAPKARQCCLCVHSVDTSPGMAYSSAVQTRISIDAVGGVLASFPSDVTRNVFPSL